MGCELVSDPTPHTGGGVGNDPAPLPLTRLIYRHLPFYLSIGMSISEYLDGDCTLVRYYRRAYEYSCARRNRELWLAGAYFYEALKDVSPIFHAFAKKGTTTLPYPDEPFPLTAKEAAQRREKRERTAYDMNRAAVAAWAGRVNLSIAARKGEDDGRGSN